MKGIVFTFLRVSVYAMLLFNYFNFYCLHEGYPLYPIGQICNFPFGTKLLAVPPSQPLQ